MNHATNDFVGAMVAKFPMAGRVLEIGSRDIGGTHRHWFTAGEEGTRYETWHSTERFPEFVGIDLVAGNAVDIVMDCHELAFDNESFGVVLSTSQMEHDSDPFRSMAEISRVLKTGGYFIFTAPSWRGEGPHDYHDYWRFMPESISVLFKRANLEVLEFLESVESNDVMACGRKQ